MTPSERRKLMRRLGDLVAQNAERLGSIEVRDNGKLLAESEGAHCDADQGVSP